jgi:hypothetical protein
LATRARPAADTNAAACCTAAHGALTALARPTTDADATANTLRGIAGARATPTGAANAEGASRSTHVTEEAAIVGADVAGIALAGALIAESSIKTGVTIGRSRSREPRGQAGWIAGHAKCSVVRCCHCLGCGRSTREALDATNGAKITRVRSTDAEIAAKTALLADTDIALAAGFAGRGTLQAARIAGRARSASVANP